MIKPPSVFEQLVNRGAPLRPVFSDALGTYILEP